MLSLLLNTTSKSRVFVENSNQKNYGKSQRFALLNVTLKYDLKTSRIIINSIYFVLIILLYGSILLTSKGLADTTTELNKNQKDMPWIEALKIQDSNEWQEFKKKKEIADLNYDLYRMSGPNITDNVILAQDPKSYFINNHNKNFCSNNVDKRCPVTSPLYVYGNLKTNILLENLYHNKDQIQLASEVIKNIINPFPSNLALEMLNASDQERELPENKAALAEVYASEARLGIARNSFHSIFFNRIPLNSGDNSSTKPQEKLSVIKIMEQQVKNRFENLAWHNNLDNANLDAKLKEIAEMESFKIWLSYHQYKQNERIESLLATLVAQQESMYKLLAQVHEQNR